MASKTLKSDREVVTLDEFERDLRRRRDRAVPVDPPRNSGKRRSPSKQALLDAIKRSGSGW